MEAIRKLGTDSAQKLPERLTVAFLRQILLKEKTARLQKLAADRNDGFTELYHILKEEGAGLDEFGHGVAPETSVDVESQAAAIALFREKWDTLDKLDELLELDLAAISPSPSPAPTRAASPTQQALKAPPRQPEDAPFPGISKQLQSPTKKIDRKLDTDGDTSMDALSAGSSAMPLLSVSASSDSASHQPSTSGFAAGALQVPRTTLPPVNSPLHQADTGSASTVPSSIPPVASTSQLPPVLPQNLSNSSAPPTPSSSGPPAPLPVPQIALNYTDDLPPISQDFLRQRLASRKKGKDKDKHSGANGGPDLYRLHVKAQHTGAKNFLGRGKRVHNVMSTADYSVAMEELRAIRAFERIEQLKAEKLWSFRQPRKQRAGAVPKSHWDHLLDEMRWLQTDFRQEKRWKMVTAHTLARAVQDWHRATPVERLALCIRTSPPKPLPLETDSGGSATSSRPVTTMTTRGGKKESLQVEAVGEWKTRSGEMDVDVEGEVAVEGDPDADGDVDAEGELASADGDVDSIKAGFDALPLTSPSALALADSDTARQTLDPHSLTALRAPIFDLGAQESIIDVSTLDYQDDGQLPLTMEILFPELPIYSIIPPDAAHDKRIEEASAFSGRISNVSKHFDSRPLLVSTLQPAKTRSTAGWNATMSYNLEDVKEIGDAHELLPVTSNLFSADRKGKVVAKLPPPDPQTKVTPLPNAELRATSLLWAPEEDALLVSLRQQYGANWDLIADFFNGAIIRPSTDRRLPWDMYDRWDRLAGPGSKKLLEDGTEISVPLPEYVAPIEKGKSPQFSNFEGSKKRLRHLSVFDAMRKQQKKRDATQKPPSGIPRRLNMNMHESHNLPQRPVFTPIEWSNLKLEQDRNKQEITRRVQLQQQQEMAVAHQRLQQQQQQQQQQQSGARYQQVPAQGFPLQQGRTNSLPLNISQQNQGRLGIPSPNGTPGSPLPLSLPMTSPRPTNASSPVQGQGPNGAQFAPQYALAPNGSPLPNLAALVQAQALANGGQQQATPTPEQIALYNQRQAAIRSQQQSQSQEGRASVDHGVRNENGSA